MPKVTIKHPEIPGVINFMFRKAPETSVFQNKDILFQVEWHHSSSSLNFSGTNTSRGPLGSFQTIHDISNLKSHTLSFFLLLSTLLHIHLREFVTQKVSKIIWTSKPLRLPYRKSSFVPGLFVMLTPIWGRAGKQMKEDGVGMANYSWRSFKNAPHLFLWKSSLTWP